MNDDLVSVIMATYNEERFLADSIESVLNQTYRDIELLITDDCSTNKAVIDILEDFKKRDKRVKVFYLPENQGPGKARNKSIEEAKGRFIAFCDSDDRWMPEKIEKQVALMNETDCCLSYSSYLTCDEDGVNNGFVAAPWRVTLKMMTRDNKIGCLTGIYDTKPYGKFFMPPMRKRQDWALFLEILKKCGYGCGITEPLAYYRKRKNSVSKDKKSLLKYNALVYQEILGFSKAKAYFYLVFVFLPTYTFKVFGNKIRSLKWKKHQESQ